MAISMFQGIIAGLVVIIFIVIAGGVSYYYLKGKKETDNAANATAPIPEEPEEDFAPSPLKIQLFTECNYQGTKYELGVGNHYASKNHFPDNQISSIKIPVGLQATIYEFDRKGGRSKLYTPCDIPCLPTAFLRVASSIRVSVFQQDVKMGPLELAGNRKVRMWNVQVRGYKDLTVGSYSVPSQYSYDEVGLFKIPYGIRVKVTYTDGSTDEQFGDTYWTDKFKLRSRVVQSFLIEEFIPPYDTQARVTFYSETDFSGLKFEAGVGLVQNPIELLPSIQSFVVPTNLQVVFLNSGGPIKIYSWTAFTGCTPGSNSNTYGYYCKPQTETKLVQLVSKNPTLKIMIMPVVNNQGVSLYPT